MKRMLLCLLLICALVPLPAPATGLPRVGVCLYASRDTFIAGLAQALSRRAEGRADLVYHYAEGDQNRQNDQVLTLLKEGVDALVVNPVDRISAVYIIRLCRQHDIPVVFINREPLKEDLRTFARAYYVGIDPTQQGTLQGQAAANYFKQHPQADLNGDGIIQMVLLRGEPGHQDTELRSLYAQRALRGAGMQVEKVGEETALWDKALAQERMSMLLGALGNRVELVLTNNDDMALGAIDALKAAGYFTGGRFIPVLGVDATAPALEMVEQRSLYATVQNDAGSQALAALDLAVLLAARETPSPDNYPFDMHNKTVYLPSVVVTRETLEQQTP